MNSMQNNKQKSFSGPSKGHISYAQIGVILVSMLIGSLLMLFYTNAAGRQATTFTTLDLIGFVFSIALGSTSIVLAITAMIWGKTSEQTMAQKSDESMRIQNEVFGKTIEVLQRIESSTGVTEKRVEDIIAGRVGHISAQVVDQAVNERIITPRGRSLLESQIQDSLIRAIKPEDLSDREREERKEHQEARNRYFEYKDKLLLSIANNSGFIIEKIGDGTFEGEGKALVDGVFLVGERRYGVATFSAEYHREFVDGGIVQYVRELYKQIAAGAFHKVILCFNNDVSTGSIPIQLEKAKAICPTELAGKVVVLGGDEGYLADNVVKIIREES
jgi:membrane protein implicated in regulation of membrane protease activity